jgi:FkbM family methyltransferase
MSLGKIRVQWDFLASQPSFQKAPVRVLFRLLAWRWLCFRNKPKSIFLPTRQLSLFLPPEWRGIAKLLYMFRDDYDPDLNVLEKFLGAEKTMIDIGANHGMYSLVSARLVGNEGKVIAFEPTQATFKILEKNLALNHATNVKAMRIALADKPGTMRLYHEVDSTRNSLAPAVPSQDFEEVEVRTLDSVIRDAGLARIDFIKIDVEGADELVCRGGSAVLEKFRPPVFFEYNSLAASQMGLKTTGTPAFLASLGYDFYTFRDGKFFKLADGDFPECNILALHPSSAPEFVKHGCP